MFGLSWAELGFCAVLALIVIGPRDLPKAARAVADVVNYLRNTYAQLAGGIKQLEREVALVESPPNSDGASWKDYLPPDVAALRDSIQPHTDAEITRKQYQELRGAVAKAKADFAADQETKAQGDS